LDFAKSLFAESHHLFAKPFFFPAVVVSACSNFATRL
jgi:hypothetical protein